MPKSLQNRTKGPCDNLFIRSFLFVVGAFFLAIAIFTVLVSNSIPWWGYLIISVFIIAGLYYSLISLFGSNKIALSVAEKTGNHEIVIIFIVIAGIISASVRKLKNAL